MTQFFTPISFSHWHQDKAGFAARIGAALTETGFVVIKDHGLDQNIIDRALADTKAFFALPQTVKRAYHQDGGGGQRGYTPFGTENAKGQNAADLKEFWHTGRTGAAGTAHEACMPPTPSVREVPGFDNTTGALYAALDEMGQNLLSAIAIHLGLTEDWFAPRVATGNSILRVLHYPAHTTPPPAGSLRAAAHEDINVITLLLGAEEAGLEVRRRSGEWLSVNPPPGALVVNIGDMLQRLTNDLLPSTTHRVVNPSPERSTYARYSTPFFLHFAPDVMIEPLESCQREGQIVLPAITAHDYLMERLRQIGLVKP